MQRDYPWISGDVRADEVRGVERLEHALSASQAGVDRTRHELLAGS